MGGRQHGVRARAAAGGAQDPLGEEEVAEERGHQQVLAEEALEELCERGEEGIGEDEATGVCASTWCRQQCTSSEERCGVKAERKPQHRSISVALLLAGSMHMLQLLCSLHVAEQGREEQSRVGQRRAE